MGQKKSVHKSLDITTKEVAVKFVQVVRGEEGREEFHKGREYPALWTQKNAWHLYVSETLRD